MRQDRLVGIGILVVGAILLAETFTFRVNDWEPLGMAFWPRVLLGILGVCAVYLVLRGSLDDGPFERLSRTAFLALAAGVVYVLLLDRIGFLLLTPLFLFAAVLMIGRSMRWPRLIEAGIVALVTTVVINLVFHRVLLVQLPEGLLG